MKIKYVNEKHGSVTLEAVPDNAGMLHATLLVNGVQLGAEASKVLAYFFEQLDPEDNPWND